MAEQKTIGQKLYELINPCKAGDPIRPAMWDEVDEDYHAHYERAAAAFLNSEAAASAVWDQAVEACADAIKEVEKELAAEGEVYILVKTVEALRSLKRSDKTESDNGGCQAYAGAKGDTVSREGRGLPRHFSLHFCANKDGFLAVYSDDVPEFYISGSNDQTVAADIEPILSRILWENYGTTIAGFCRRQARSELEEAQRADTMPLTSGETPDTNNQEADNG